MPGNFNLRFGHETCVSGVSYAPLYSAQFLDKHHTSKKHQPPYTPDMNPCDFSLFLQTKNTLKGIRFEDVEMIKFNVIQKLLKTPKTEYRRCIQQQVEQPLEKVWIRQRVSVHHQRKSSTVSITELVQVPFDQAL
jgi:hypothetical protein